MGSLGEKRGDRIHKLFSKSIYKSKNSSDYPGENDPKRLATRNHDVKRMMKATSRPGYLARKKRGEKKHRQAISSDVHAKVMTKRYPWHAKDSEDRKLTHHNPLLASIPNLRKPDIHLKKNKKGVYESKLILEYLKPTLSKGASRYRKFVRGAQISLANHIAQHGVGQSSHEEGKKVIGFQRAMSKGVNQKGENREKRLLGKKKMYDPVKAVHKLFNKDRKQLGEIGKG